RVVLTITMPRGPVAVRLRQAPQHCPKAGKATLKALHWGAVPQKINVFSVLRRQSRAISATRKAIQRKFNCAFSREAEELICIGDTVILLQQRSIMEVTSRGNVEGLIHR